LAVFKRTLFIATIAMSFQTAYTQPRFVPRWQGRVSGGISYWKLSDLNRRIESRRPFFAAAGDSAFPLGGLSSVHPSFNVGLQYDLFSKLSILGTLEYRQATAKNVMTNDSLRVEAVTRPRLINLGLNAFWRLGPEGKWMFGGGGGISFARFRDEVRVFDNRTDTLTRFLLEKYSSRAIYGELRVLYNLSLSFTRGQTFFIEALARLNPIEAFTGTKNDNGNIVNDFEATVSTPGSNILRPVKLDFSGFYLGIGSHFDL
jgi:hypothetical protein